MDLEFLTHEIWYAIKQGNQTKFRVSQKFSKFWYVVLWSTFINVNKVIQGVRSYLTVVSNIIMVDV